jgi:hypothetical protein
MSGKGHSRTCPDERDGLLVVAEDRAGRLRRVQCDSASTGPATTEGRHPLGCRAGKRLRAEQVALGPDSPMARYPDCGPHGRRWTCREPAPCGHHGPHVRSARGTQRHARGLDGPPHVRAARRPRGRSSADSLRALRSRPAHDGTSESASEKKPTTSGRRSALQVDDAVLTADAGAAGTGARAVRRPAWRVESHDGVASCRTRVARASPVRASRRPMAADGLRAVTRPPRAA